MIFKPENSALARSQGPGEPVLDSCKFQGFIPKFSRYLPLSGGADKGMYKFVDLEGKWLSGAFAVLNRWVDRGIVAS